VDQSAELVAANARYYQAFEAADLDAMSEVWERTARVTCTHPGWATLRGWAQVSASYFALFSGPVRTQFVLTGQQVVLNGATGWLSLDENLLGEQAGVAVAALNVFVRDGGRWSLVCHHGSVVHAAGD
jgi:hypothetical protein